MSLFRNLLLSKYKSSLYLIYNTSTLTNERIGFETTSDMKSWISDNSSSLTGSLTAVRKNIDDGFTDYTSFFRDCSSLSSIDLSDFDIEGATSIDNMFRSNSALSNIIGLNNLDVSAVTALGSVFYYCTSLTTLDLSSWDTQNATTTAHMCRGCSSLTSVNFANIDTSSITTTYYMFNGCSSLDTVYWATNKETVQNIKSSSGLANANTIYVPSALIDNYKSASYFSAWADNIVGYGEVESSLYLIYNTESVADKRIEFSSTADMKAFIKSNYSILIGSLIAVRKNIDDGFTDFSTFFWGATDDFDEDDQGSKLLISSLDLSEFDTTGATDMYSMFRGCTYAEEITGLENFDTSNVTNTSFMFYCCSALTELDISSFDTSNVTNMQSMFHLCDCLTELDVSSFDTSNVTDMSYMFYTCMGLATLDLSNFDTSNVTSMNSMFESCGFLTTLNLSNFDTSNVTDMYSMFQGWNNGTGSVYWATNKDTVQSLQTLSRLGENAKTIYVPSALVDDYKSAQYFSAWAEQIIGI